MILHFDLRISSFACRCCRFDLGKLARAGLNLTDDLSSEDEGAMFGLDGDDDDEDSDYDPTTEIDLGSEEEEEEKRRKKKSEKN